jgi:hypothetical protein
VTNRLALQSRVPSGFRKTQLYSGICGRSAYGEIRGLKVLAEGEELGSNLLQVIERTRSGLDRHRLWQQYNGIWIFAMSGRAEMGVLLIRRIRAYVTGENISLYVLGWDLLDIVPVQRNRRFVAVELNPDAVAVAAATDDDAFPLGSARATRRTARAHSKSRSYGNGRRR